MEMLTVEGIGPRWPRRVDRRKCSAFGEETEEKKLERGGSRAAQLGGSEGLRWWRRADWGAFYRRDEAVEEGRTPVAGLGKRRGAPLMAFVVAMCGSAIRGGDAMVRAARTHREDAYVEGPGAQLGVASRGPSDEAAALCASSARTAARAARRPGDVTCPAAASGTAAWSVCARAWMGGWR